jgi:multiple sugar transport system ATP-binding protein
LIAVARIEIDHVTKRFGDTIAVDDATITIENNEFFCFFGPPSSGKTTILRLLLGLERPDSGEIHIDGKRVNELSPAQRNLAMVFQNLALFPHMTARENVIFPLVERQVASNVVEERLSRIADTLHIAHILHKRPAQLSGGERQRVAIGRALVRDAEAYLMDDPISALDARLREETRVELKRLQRDIGHTLVYVTHDQEEAMSVADRMAVLENGAIRQIDAPQTLYVRPCSRYVAALVGSPRMNFVPGAFDQAMGRFSSESGSWTIPLGAMPISRDEKIEIGFRPEHVSVKPLGAAGALPGKVLSVEPLGATTVVVIEAAGTVVKASLPGQHSYGVGEQVSCAVSPHQCVLFAEDGQAHFVSSSASAEVN